MNRNLISRFKPGLFGYCFLVVILLGGGTRMSEAQRYETGDIVENFTLINRANGEEVSLYDMEGKIIFLEWFAYWCPFCQAAAADVVPGIIDYYDDRDGNPAGVPVMHVGLNLQGGAESATQNFINF
jgi:thiol-disulfide isomerase/thioredoxin